MFSDHLEEQIQHYINELRVYHVVIEQYVRDRLGLSGYDLHTTIPTYPAAGKLKSAANRSPWRPLNELAPQKSDDELLAQAKSNDHIYYLGGIDVFQVIKEMVEISETQNNLQLLENILSLKQRMTDELIPPFIEECLNRLQPVNQMWVGPAGRRGSSGAHSPCRWFEAFETSDFQTSTIDVLRSLTAFKFCYQSVRELTDICLEGDPGLPGKVDPTLKLICCCSTTPVSIGQFITAVKISNPEVFPIPFHHPHTVAAKTMIERCIQADRDLHQYFGTTDCELLEWIPRELIRMIDTFSHCFQRGPHGPDGLPALLCNRVS